MDTKTIKAVLLVLALVTVFWVGGHFVYQRYEAWRQAHLNRQAREYLAKGDYQNASLCLQNALQHKTNDLETCRLMAELGETISSPNAFLWRSFVAELNPGSLEDELRLVEAAMKAGDVATAASALEAVNPAGKKTAAYHEAAGAVAVALNQLARADEHFRDAARLDPTNVLPRVNIAVVRLQSANEAALTDARNFLQNVASNPGDPGLSCLALRELTADAMRHRQTNAAMALSEKLVQHPKSLFHDRLLRLDVLVDSGNPAFPPTLASYQRQAATNAIQIADLATWQLSKHQENDALTWIESLPLAMRTNQGVAMASAICYAAIDDWHALQSLIEGQNWGDLDFARYAFDAMTLRKQGLSSSSLSEWKLAMAAASGRKQKLNMLLRLVVQWNWDDESEEVLAAIVNLDPYDNGSFQALSKVLFSRGHTRSLMLLYSDKAGREPWNLAAKNNLTWTALLLNAQEMLPDYLAQELYRKAPTNSAFASTYALSLLLQRKNSEALKVFEKLDPRDLDNPSIAGCYGMVLTANGNEAKAKKYLDLGSQAPMLPEQRDLMDAARRRTGIFMR